MSTFEADQKWVVVVNCIVFLLETSHLYFMVLEAAFLIVSYDSSLV